MLGSCLLALLIASPALAQNASILPSFIQALNSSGLVRLASAIQNISQTPIGQQLVADLPNGNRTFFAPVDKAFNGKPPSNITDQNTLAAILSYHLVAGSFNTSVFANAPNHTLVHTFMNSSQLVNLEGGRSQVLSLSNINGTVQILGQNTLVQIINSTTFQNMPIHIINAVIDPPAPLTDVLGSRNLTLFSSVATQAGILSSLGSGPGITIFAPTDAAFSAAIKSLDGGASQPTGNASQIATVLQNHVVNGTSVYAGEFDSGNWTSAAGEPFHFTTNGTGTFVTSGNSTAKIVESDVLTSNGVVHVIDGVLVNTQNDPSAASSAFQSATSAASSTPTPTNPIGPTGSGGGSSNNGGNNGNGTSGNQGKGNSAVGNTIFSLRLLFGSFFLVLLGASLI